MSAPVQKKRRLSQRAQIVLIVLALVAAAAAGYFFVVGPKRAASAKLDEEIAALEQQIVTARLAASPGAGSTSKVETARLFRLVKAMPDRADMAGVILQLNRTAADTGIVFESIAPGAAVVSGAYQRVPITLEFEGDFYSLSDFLYRLRNLVQVRDGELTSTGRLFAVDSLTFSELAGSFPRISATLTVSAYVYGTGAPVTSAAPPPASTTPPAGTETTAPSDAPTAAPTDTPTTAPAS